MWNELIWFMIVTIGRFLIMVMQLWVPLKVEISGPAEHPLAYQEGFIELIGLEEKL
jgi:hypothetical protein